MCDAHELTNLLHTYAERIDAGDLDGVADLFAHGRILRPQGDAVGREGAREMYRQARLYDDGTPRTRHVTTNAIVEVDAGGETAAVRSYFTVFQQTDVLALQPIIAGRYHDTFHRVEGAWCFATRRILVDQLGDLSQHLDPERADLLNRS